MRINWLTGFNWKMVMQKQKWIKWTMVVGLMFTVVLGTADAMAGSASVCEHYLGADVAISHSTDASISNSLYYGEACSFKFNIQSTVYDSPAHAVAPGVVSQTDRLEFDIYLQTQEWGLRNVFETPVGDPTPDLSDPATQAENYKRHVKWSNDTHGYAPAAAAYQGGGASPSTTGMLFDYMLAGRTSAMSAYNNDVASWIEDSGSNDTKYYKVSTRFGDEVNGINNSMGVLENAINAGGWYRDFCHWHTNPYMGDTLHDFFQAVNNKVNSHSDKRILYIGSGTHAQQAWYRSIATAGLTDNSGSLDVAVTYAVPSWMLVEWTWDGFTSKPVDCFVNPASIKVDTSGTSLSGSDLTASGAASLRKIGTDEFVVEVPFNRISETVTVTLTTTASPDYANEALPVINSIAEDGSNNWTVETDQATKMVIFTLPVGTPLSAIECYGSVPADQVQSPLRDNTSSQTHTFNLTKSSSFDYYVGVITEQGQSILQELVEDGTPPSNYPPTADAGSDQTVIEGAVVTLDASGSSDTDGFIASYLWQEGAVFLSSNETFDKSDFSIGVHTITLTVTDDDGAADDDTVTITVNETPTPKPTNLSPVDAVAGVAVDALLSWENAVNPASHDIYFGTDQTEVINADRNSDVYMGNQLIGEPNAYDPNLGYGATYYWRVDAVNDLDIPEWAGDVWSFTTDKTQFGLVGDLDGDLIVDINDLQLFGAQWLNGPGCPEPNCADFDGLDGVNLSDFSAMAFNWLEDQSEIPSITFLAHLNDNTSWDINPVNGDYAAGSGTASAAGSPGWDTGFFSVSSPANRAFNAASGSDTVAFDGADNIDYESQTSGGITIGCWHKIQDTGDAYRGSKLFKVGNATDYVAVWYGPGQQGKARLQFWDSGVYTVVNSATDTNSSLLDWVYFALTVDLTNQECILRQYDSSGNLLVADTFSVTISGWDAKDNASSEIELGGWLSSCDKFFVEEFSIDNRVLTGTEIQDRVDTMVAGVEL